MHRAHRPGSYGSTRWGSTAAQGTTEMNARKRTWWKVTHPELGLSIVVAAASDDEARAAAWRQWYRRAPRNEFEGLIRDACGAEDTGEAAQGNGRPKPS